MAKGCLGQVIFLIFLTTAFSVTAYKAARIAMATVKGDASRYVQAHGTLLVGHPTLEDAFLRAEEAYASLAQMQPDDAKPKVGLEHLLP